MMRTVRLSGELGRRFGKYHRFAIKTPGEAIRALCANFPGFKEWLIDSERRGVFYRVLTGRKSQSIDAIHDHSPESVFSVCPVFTGGKSRWLSVVAGIALIGASFFLPATPLLGGALGGITWSGAAFSIGTLLLLNGVAGLLNKPPSANDPKRRPGYFFNGAVNTDGQGLPIPIGYGRLMISGPVISASFQTEDLP